MRLNHTPIILAENDNLNNERCPLAAEQSVNVGSLGYGNSSKSLKIEHVDQFTL